MNLQERLLTVQKGRRPFAVVLVDADADGYVVSIPDSCTAHPRSQH
jgi:hypothetical protein